MCWVVVLPLGSRYATDYHNHHRFYSKALYRIYRQPIGNLQKRVVLVVEGMP